MSELPPPDDIAAVAADGSAALAPTGPTGPTGPTAPTGPSESPEPPVAPQPPLPVLYLDEHFVAVSKPTGLLVHRDEHHPNAPAALQTVRDQLGKHLFPFHRLDRATSGILMFGFSRKVAAALQESLAAEDAHKDYTALLRFPGSDPGLPAQWTCDRPLHDDKDVARASRTDFAFVETFRGCGLAHCRLFTGRYHQIRRHANHSGRHVLGDTTHGKGRLNALFRARYGLDRLFLHLHRICLRHPVTDAPMELLDPLPIELVRVLERLRQEPAPACPPSPS